MEQHVAVHDDEPVQQQRSCQPQRVQAVGLREPRVLHELHAAAAAAPDPLGFAADHDDDVVDAAGAQDRNLPLDQRQAADARQAFRQVAGGAIQARALAGRQHHAPHRPLQVISLPFRTG